MPESAVSWSCSHQHTDTERNTVADTNEPQMRVNDKGVSCSKPLACAQTAARTDARQMRVTDIETRQLGPTSTSVGLLALNSDGDRCRCNVSITFRHFPLVDIVGGYVGAFHGTILSSPVLGLHPRLKGLHSATAAASSYCSHAYSSRRRPPSSRAAPICISPSMFVCFS